jgi:hypothetical protein
MAVSCGISVISVQTEYTELWGMCQEENRAPIYLTSHLVPFTLYLDDSGTSPSQSIACATALIIPAGRIFLMEAEWDRLKKKEGFSDFHTSVFVAKNRHSEFATWDDAKLKRVFARVCQITKKYTVQIFSFTVKKDDYETCIPPELRQYSGKYHYSWAIRHLISFVQRWRIGNSVPEPYEWIFDWMPKKDLARKEIEAVMEQAEDEARRARGAEHEYENFTFRPRSSLAGLQCADLVAWTNYNMSLERFRNTHPSPFAKWAWNDFASMPKSTMPIIHRVLEWNFAVTILANQLKDWAQKEIADGRSLVRFQEWEGKKKTKSSKP